MDKDKVSISEMFFSVQGESTYCGLPCFFVRLAGCNMRCRYCDTTYTYEGGTETPIEEIVRRAKESQAAIVEITGGEPLLQEGFHSLAEALRDETKVPVLVETNGSIDISIIPEAVIAVMDIKCPGSGECTDKYLGNIAHLREYDEIKFVLTDRTDYEWARNILQEHELTRKCHAVLFSAAEGFLDIKKMAEWVITDRLPVRIQVQLHKILGVK